VGRCPGEDERLIRSIGFGVEHVNEKMASFRAVNNCSDLGPSLSAHDGTPRRFRTSPPCCGRAAPDPVDLHQAAGEAAQIGVYPAAFQATNITATGTLAGRKLRRTG
jgi:hypothetical protein